MNHNILNDLNLTYNLVYQHSGFTCSQPLFESESSQYCACTFTLGGLAIRFRAAKITPKKVGQFVTLWKRIGKGQIQPFDVSDPNDFFVISVRKGDLFGQFVFPKSVLRDRGVLSKNGIGGKLAIRVYPPWDNPESALAQKTQKWQLEYFLDIYPCIDYSKVRLLYTSLLSN